LKSATAPIGLPPRGKNLRGCPHRLASQPRGQAPLMTLGIIQVV